MKMHVEDPPEAPTQWTVDDLLLVAIAIASVCGGVAFIALL